MKRVLLLTIALIGSGFAADDDIMSAHDLKELSYICADDDPIFEGRVTNFVLQMQTEGNPDQLRDALHVLKNIYGLHDERVVALQNSLNKTYDERVQEWAQGDYNKLFDAFSERFWGDDCVDDFTAALRRALVPHALKETDCAKLLHLSSTLGSSVVVEHFLNFMLTQEVNYDIIKEFLRDHRGYICYRSFQFQIEAIAVKYASHLLQVQKYSMPSHIYFLSTQLGKNSPHYQAVVNHYALLILQENAGNSFRINSFLSDLPKACEWDSEPLQRLAEHLSCLLFQEKSPSGIMCSLVNILNVCDKTSKTSQRVEAHLVKCINEANFESLVHLMQNWVDILVDIYGKSSASVQSLISRMTGIVPLDEDFAVFGKAVLKLIGICDQSDPRIQELVNCFVEKAFFESDFKKLQIASQVSEKFYGKQSEPYKSAVVRLADSISSSPSIYATLEVAEQVKEFFGQHNQWMRALRRHLLKQLPTINPNDSYGLETSLRKSIDLFGTKNRSVKHIAKQFFSKENKHRFREHFEWLAKLYKKESSRVQAAIDRWQHIKIPDSVTKDGDSPGYYIFQDVLDVCDKEDLRVQSVLKRLIEKTLDAYDADLRKGRNDECCSFVLPALLSIFGQDTPLIQQGFDELYVKAISSNNIPVIGNLLHQLLHFYPVQDSRIIEVSLHLKAQITQKQYRPFLNEYFSDKSCHDSYVHVLDTLKAVFGQEGIEDIITRLAKQGARNEGWQAEKVYQLLADYVDEADPRLALVRENINPK